MVPKEQRQSTDDRLTCEIRRRRGLSEVLGADIALQPRGQVSDGIEINALEDAHRSYLLLRAQ